MTCNVFSGTLNPTQSLCLKWSIPIYVTPDRAAEYFDGMPVCLSLCPPVYLINDIQTSRNFLYMLPVAEAQSCCDDSALYVMYFQFCGWHRVCHMANRAYTQSDSPGGRIVGEVMTSAVALFTVWEQRSQGQWLWAVFCAGLGQH